MTGSQTPINLRNVTESESPPSVSNELATTDMPVVGEIVEHEPFTSSAEAQRFMADALSLLREGIAAQALAHERLGEARQRRAWAAMGFESWEDCLASLLSDVYNIKMNQARRIPLVAELRMTKASTAEIAKITGTHPATVTRDLEVARTTGLLAEEPDRVAGSDGRLRPTRVPRPSDGKPRQVRRADFAKAFRGRMADLERVYRSLEQMRDDERYKLHLPTLADTYAARLDEVYRLFTQLREDFESTRTEGGT